MSDNTCKWNNNALLVFHLQVLSLGKARIEPLLPLIFRMEFWDFEDNVSVVYFLRKLFVGVVAQMTSSVVEASFDLRVNSHNLTEPVIHGKVHCWQNKTNIQQFKKEVFVVSPMLHPTGCIMQLHVKEWDRKRPKEETKRQGCANCASCGCANFAMCIMHFNWEMHPSWEVMVYC